MDRLSKAVERAKKAVLDSFEFTVLVDEILDKYDLVDVVRCKHCKHYCGEETYTNHRICEIWNEEVFANGYCYYGERKEQDDG